MDKMDREKMDREKMVHIAGIANIANPKMNEG